MRRVFYIPLTLAVAAAIWMASARSVTPLATLPGIINLNDRVKEARLQHGATIRRKYQAAAVEYPGEIFLRWLKHEATLELWARNPHQPFSLISTYAILASSGKPGPKRREGDWQVPEGFYQIDRFNPNSSYHLSLGLNYPNAADCVLSDPKQPGSDIFIHGSNVSIGCAPIGDEAIEEVFLAALDARARGQARIAVHIFPGRMIGPDWDQFASAEVTRRPDLAPFWAQLQPIFISFETHRIIPSITVAKDGRYEMR
jgi:murein L,D-transpeptidase YafK